MRPLSNGRPSSEGCNIFAGVCQKRRNKFWGRGSSAALTPCVQFVCYFYIALFGDLPLPSPCTCYPASPLSYSICSIWFCRVHFIFSQARMQKIPHRSKGPVKFYAFVLAERAKKWGGWGEHCRQLYDRENAGRSGNSGKCRKCRKSEGKCKTLCLSIGSCSKETLTRALTQQLDSFIGTSSYISLSLLLRTNARKPIIIYCDCTLRWSALAAHYSRHIVNSARRDPRKPFHCMLQSHIFPQKAPKKKKEYIPMDS